MLPTFEANILYVIYTCISLFVYAVSSGSVTVNADSSVQLLAEEAVPLDQLDIAVSIKSTTLLSHAKRSGHCSGFPSAHCNAHFLFVFDLNGNEENMKRNFGMSRKGFYTFCSCKSWQLD